MGPRAVVAQLAAVVPCVAALAGVAGCTWFAFHIGLNLGSVGFVYLIFVVLAAFYGGFWQATIVSVIAAASLDYFFDEPLFSFSVAKLADWVELGAFEFTALAISELSNRAQLRASEAEAERRDTDRLYQTARRLLLLENPGNPGNLMSLLIRETFDLRAVVLFDGLSTKLYESGDTVAGAIERTREAYFSNTDSFDPGNETWFCVLRVGKRPVGALALCGTRNARLGRCGTGLSGCDCIGARSHTGEAIPCRGRAPRRTTANRGAGLAGAPVQNAFDSHPNREFRSSRFGRIVGSTNRVSQPHRSRSAAG